MYCSVCGAGLAPGTSFCNRCGTSLKEPAPRSGPITAYLTAITLIGTAGLGIMLGGALTLKNEAGLKEELVGFFMLFTFLIVAIVEILLIRQLSRFTSTEQKRVEPAQPFMAQELRPPQQRMLSEQMASVTENTTRTLEYLPSELSE
jgi:uncharacterized OB-fold protein